MMGDAEHAIIMYSSNLADDILCLFISDGVG